MMSANGKEYSPRDLGNNSGALDECIGDCALIEKALTNQLAAITCTRSRFFDQVNNFRFARQPSRTPKSAVIAECIGDYASNEADWVAYPIHPIRPHEWSTLAHGLNGGG
jgi:hypothetical protein